jgi:phenylpropionate dioxygenase-like ring-hydroxylating dioxygenase large terminal subunit
MFLKNNWYVAGFAADLGTAPLARKICGQSVVLFRTGTGKAVALEDRCIHRGMPLSQGGECIGDTIRCPYHGLEYDSSGVCTKIPGQDRVPPNMRLRVFPLVERDALLWIWPGDADKADASSIISYPYHTDPAWVWTHAHIHLKAGWQLLNDNLLDLSHLQHVHKKTIGGNPEEDAKAKLSAERVGNTVQVSRWLLDMDAPPFHRAVCGFKGKIDRWQEIVFMPGVLRFYSGATDAGTGAYEGRREGGMHLRHFHAISPETETSTNYFFSQARNFNIADTDLTEKTHKLMVFTFEEDKGILEPQQLRLIEQPDRPLLNLKADAGIVQARKIVQELIAAEQAGSSDTVRAIA